MPDLNTYLFSQGVLGVACLVLGIVCVKLYNKTDRQQQRIEELQNLRLADSKEVNKEVTEVLQGNSQSSRILAEKIEAGKRGNR